MKYHLIFNQTIKYKVSGHQQYWSVCDNQKIIKNFLILSNIEHICKKNFIKIDEKEFNYLLLAFPNIKFDFACRFKDVTTYRII